MKKLNLLLVPVLILGLFSGCAQTPDAYVPTGDGLTWEEDYTGPVYTRPPQEAQELTLTWYPDRSMHPYESTDFTNRALFSLIYQSLFISDRDYGVEPLLCESYRMSDNMTVYTFFVDKKATFSDGTPVRAQDVLASLLAAKDSEYYGGRFTYVLDMSLSEDGGVRISLGTPMENLPLLLDIPILKESQLEDPMPIGSGPYVLKASGQNGQLLRRSDWWCDPEMAVTAEKIPLLPAENPTQIRDNFEFADLDLVCADPGTDRYSDYRCDFELWDCENGMFLYLTVCADSQVFMVPEVRQALTHAIDRDRIVDQFYRGFARAASLPASPLSPWYNASLADKYAYDPLVFTKAVKDAGLKDVPITLLVNKDDSLRLRVAREIGRMLSDCGLKVNMKELNGNDYIYALQTRQFDLYLGQTKLSPNMDLTPFFTAVGQLSWGGVNDVAAYNLCLQALENEGNYYTLHQYVMENTRLCPILFRSYAVFATRGLVTGLTPSRDNIFRYSLGRSMETALRKPEPPAPAQPSETTEATTESGT